MASSSAESSCKCHVRSVSFPSGSHPVSRSIEDALHRLKHANSENTSSVSFPSGSHPVSRSIEDALHRLKHANSENTSSFESISSGLARLEDLYRCVDDLLDMASTQQILRRQVGCTNVLLDSSVLLLDVCSIARDLVLQVKEYVHLLQSTLRRRKGDASMKASLRDYMNFRNKARKDAKRLNSAMNQINNRAGIVSQPDQDLESSPVTRILIEVNEISTATFQSVLYPFLNHVSGIKPSRWSLISRFVQKVAVVCEEKRGNLDELECIDGAIHAVSKCSLDDAETTKIQLQDAENGVNSLEVTLENMFRQLIRSRASLLNIISQ